MQRAGKPDIDLARFFPFSTLLLSSDGQFDLDALGHTMGPAVLWNFSEELQLVSRDGSDADTHCIPTCKLAFFSTRSHKVRQRECTTSGRVSCAVVAVRLIRDTIPRAILQQVDFTRGEVKGELLRRHSSAGYTDTEGYSGDVVSSCSKVNVDPSLTSSTRYLGGAVSSSCALVASHAACPVGGERGSSRSSPYAQASAPVADGPVVGPAVGGTPLRCYVTQPGSPLLHPRGDAPAYSFLRDRPEELAIEYPLHHVWFGESLGCFEITCLASFAARRTKQFLWVEAVHSERISKQVEHIFCLTVCDVSALVSTAELEFLLQHNTDPRHVKDMTSLRALLFASPPAAFSDLKFVATPHGRLPELSVSSTLTVATELVWATNPRRTNRMVMLPNRIAGNATNGAQVWLAFLAVSSDNARTRVCNLERAFTHNLHNRAEGVSAGAVPPVDWASCPGKDGWMKLTQLLYEDFMIGIRRCVGALQCRQAQMPRKPLSLLCFVWVGVNADLRA